MLRFTYNRGGKKFLTAKRFKANLTNYWTRNTTLIWSKSNKNLGSRSQYQPFGGYNSAGHLIFELERIDDKICNYWDGKVFLHMYRTGIGDIRPDFHNEKEKVELCIQRCGETRN